MELNSIENSNSQTIVQTESNPAKNSSNSPPNSNQQQNEVSLDKIDISEKSIALSKNSKQQNQEQNIVQEGTEKTPQERVDDESAKASEQTPIEREIENLSLTPRFLQFKFNETENPDTGEISKELVVHIKNLKTGELIRTVPPENIFEEIKKFPPEYPQIINRFV